MNKVEKLFEKHEEEYADFEHIPEKDRRHPRPDVCAFIYLHEKLGGSGDAISAAGHDEIWLDWDDKELKKLTDEDVLYLTRCGVRYNGEGLAMFV